MNNPTRCTSFAIVSKNKNWARKITSWGHGVICRCVGYYGEEDAPSRRLARPLVFCRTPGDCPLENGYARPVEGIHVLVDMRQMEVKSWTNLSAIYAESLLALNIFFCGYY